MVQQNLKNTTAPACRRHSDLAVRVCLKRGTCEDSTLVRLQIIHPQGLENIALRIGVDCLLGLRALQTVFAELHAKLDCLHAQSHAQGSSACEIECSKVELVVPDAPDIDPSVHAVRPNQLADAHVFRIASGKVVCDVTQIAQALDE